MKSRHVIILGSIVLVLALMAGCVLLVIQMDRDPVIGVPPTPPPIGMRPVPALERPPRRIPVAPLLPAQAQFMDDVRRVVNDGRPLTTFIHMGRLAQEVQARLGNAGPLAPDDVAHIDKHLPHVAAQLLLPFACQMWTASAPHWVRANEECFVLTVVREAGGLRREVGFRWWLALHEGRWQLYDVENLYDGGRLSTLLAVGLATPRATPSWTTRFADGYAALMNRDFLTLRRLIDRDEARPLPPTYQALLDCWQGVALADQWRPAEAWPYWQQAARHDPGLPAALWRQAKLAAHPQAYDDAKQLALRYLALVPNDAEALVLAGNAKIELRDYDGTSDLFRTALALNPNNVEALDGLRVALEPHALGELGPHLLQMQRPEQALPTLMTLALSGNHDDAARVYVEAFCTKFPNHYEGWFQKARMHIYNQKIHEANQELQRVLNDPRTVKDRPRYRNELLNDAAQAGHAAALYAVLPAAQQRDGLRILADALLSSGQLRQEPQPYEELLEAHRAKYPDDPWADFYQAQLHIVHDESPAAERFLAKAMSAKLTPAEQRRMGSVRAANLVRMGQWQKAYAEVPPRRETFRIVMTMSGGMIDGSPSRFLDAVAPIIDAHAKADPEDPLLPLWQGRLAHHRGQYADALKAFERFQKSTRDTEGFDYVPDEAILRTLLRLERWPEAQKILERVPLAYRSYLQLLYHAATGEVPATTKLLANLASNPFLLARLHDDPDMLFSLQKPALKHLLEKYPRPKTPPLAP